MFDFQDLKIFLAVDQYSGITKAAEKLGYVQPNITSRIKRLEQRVGFPLFIRNKRGVTLTPSGNIFANYARKILALCDEAEHAINDLACPSGSLKIGSMETTSYVRLPPILNEFQAQFPRIQLHIRTGTTNDLIEKTLNYGVDGALVAGKVDHTDLMKKTIFQEQLVLISCSPEHPFNRRDVSILAFQKGCYYREIMEKMAHAHHMKIKNIIHVDSPQAIIHCVQMGVGISLVPASMATFYPNIYVHTIADEYAEVQTNFIYKRSASSNPALLRFIELLKGSVRA